ncbi:hypothetical protein ACTHUR_20180, partial [Neisseria sp. P0021.S007]
MFAVASRIENLNPFVFSGHNESGSSPDVGRYTYDPKSNAGNTLKLIAGEGLKMTSNGTNEYTLSVVGGGAKGEKGDAGPAGPKGEKGDTGPAGAKGAKGDTGPAGAKGDTGDTGPKGDKGEKGDTGENGLNGSSVTGTVVNNNDGTHTITIT